MIKITVTKDLDNLDEVIQDPWKVFSCKDNGEGCSFQFTDSDFLNLKMKPFIMSGQYKKLV
ncbi:MAG: hypothetical protein Ct9H300mP20_13110 [Gammaproteobacteria bacterium]|nr:MAG: hypothetical protein Ct9H300mP20_13110 [Gammaproteobacteria bacterium]